MSQTRDYRDTVFLPATPFPMRGDLPKKEPAILARWAKMGIWERIREAMLRATRDPDRAMAGGLGQGIAAFGASPKLSGAYIASTRVGGSANWPGLFSRSVYSITSLPRGMNS